MQLFRFLSATLVIGAGTLFAVASDEKTVKQSPAEGKLVAKPEAFKTLVNPQCSHCVDEAKRRAGELRENDRVLAWIRGYSQGGGIPIRFFLVPYRVISDTYGVFVFDSEAGYMHGFEPSLEFEFYGWRNGIMVMKHKDGTLFSCLSGRAFEGPRKGEQLKPVPTIETDWGFWLEAYPGAVAYQMFEKYQPVEVPHVVHTESVNSRGPVDPRLAEATPVIGAAVGSSAKAYPINLLKEAGGVLHDEIGEEKVVALWYDRTGTAAIFSPRVEETNPPQSVSLSMDLKVPIAPFLDKATGSHFDIVGRAVDGPFKGKTLRWLPGVQCRWFAWAAEYPETEVVKVSGKGKPSSPKKPVIKAIEPSKSRDNPPARNTQDQLQGIIVDPKTITEENVSSWKKAGLRAIVSVLDESHDKAAYAVAARLAEAGKLDLYYWIEVGRNPAMAAAHPEWMASLGMHQDWHQRFPTVALPKEGEVAKAFPWVPIAYRESFDAHLKRIAHLLERVAEPYRGILLNDLQGGPASCGCGNLLCRWAIDYKVPSTATKLDGNDVAGSFVAEARKLVGTKVVVPVWTTECEEIDLPTGRRTDGFSTRHCGEVPCARGTCPKAYAQQWSALLSKHSGPVGVLAVHKEFGRDSEEFGEPAGWVPSAFTFLNGAAPTDGDLAISPDRVWMVVQGYDLSENEQAAARQAARKTGAGAVLVALTRLEQSYEPRIIAAK